MPPLCVQGTPHGLHNRGLAQQMGMLVGLQKVQLVLPLHMRELLLQEDLSVGGRGLGFLRKTQPKLPFQG